MCTLTLAWQVFEDAPVAVAANRDEAVGRPSDPPGVYAESPLTIAPRDREAGGTWIGATERGVFSGITNRWGDADLAGERSRGLLVADALSRDSALAAADWVERAVAADEYDGFYLVIADADDAVCLEWDGELRRTSFDPGVHVVVNVGVDETFRVPSNRPEAGTRQARNAEDVRAALASAGDETADEAGDETVDEAGDETTEETPDEWLERAGTVLGDHDYGVCIHGDGFGTRSSSLLALGEGPNALANATYRFADGPPCRTPYRNVTLERHI